MHPTAFGILLLVVGCRGSWSVEVDKSTAEFSISVDGIEWLKSTERAFGSSTMTGWQDNWIVTSQSTTSGSDPLLGDFVDYCFTWNSTLRSCYKVGPFAIIATVYYPQSGWTSKAGNSYSVLSAFPSFNFTRPDGIALGYTQWWHTFIFRQTIEMWGNTAKPPTTGADAGPIAVWDRNMSNCIVISPLTNIMASNSHLIGQSLQYGLMGTIPTLPGNQSHSTLIFYNSSGLRKSLRAWGNFFRAFHNNPVSVAAHTSDITLSKLGYSTDHGAAYYYKTLPNQTYEDTLLAVSKYYNQSAIPISYALLDSWWYTQGRYDGTVTWRPKPGIFPHGMGYLSQRTGWKFQLHNRFWSANVTYARKNNGSYDFTMEGSLSVPDEQRFWNDLLGNASRDWNMAVYEQDWLYSEWMGMTDVMLASPTRAARWLSNIDTAAAITNSTIQLCMAWPRFVLYAAAHMPQVTQVRASDDYTGDTQWYIGVSSLFISSLGFRPSKDGVRTVKSQPDFQEPLVQLQSAVASLSGGPIALVDNINYTDPEIVNKMITKNGDILTPDISGVSTDEQHVQSAFMVQNGSFTNGAVIHTSASIFGNHEWYFALASGFFYEYSLDIDKSCSISEQLSGQRWDIYEALDNKLVAVNATHFTIPVCPHAPTLRCNHTHSPVYQISPKFSSGWSLIGEYGKWVSVSRVRFTNVSPTTNGITAVLTGSPQEVLRILFVNPNGDLITKPVVLDQHGEGEVSVP